MLMRANAQRRFSGNADTITEQNKVLGLEITGKTSEPSWDGKPVDYDHILFVLGQHLASPGDRELEADRF